MLQSALKKFGVVPVETVPGAAFDPAFHQAMNQVETAEQEPNTMVSEFQKGYLLNERLLRPAMVSVARRLQNKYLEFFAAPPCFLSGR